MWDRASTVARKFGGLIRRMLVKASEGGLWEVAGHRTEEQGQESDESVPVFQGIGFASRPDNDETAEVIVGHVGGATSHPAIVALRDEGMRTAQAAVRDLEPGETVVFNRFGYAKFDAEGNLTVHSPTTIKLGASAVQPLVLGTTYRGAEDTLLGLLAALEASVAAMAVKLAIDPALAGDTKTAAGNVATPAAAFAAGVTAFTAAGATYLSTKSKTE